MDAMKLAAELVEEWREEYIGDHFSDAELGELTRRIAALLAQQKTK